MQAVLCRLHAPLGLVVAVLAGCTAPNPYLNVCGNGVVEAANDEECDEGFDGNDDRGACTRSRKEARCGDGLVQEGVELCDAGEPVGRRGNLAATNFTWTSAGDWPCALSARLICVEQ